MYELLLERGAERDLKRLPPEIFKRIIGELRALKETPRPGCGKLKDQTFRLSNMGDETEDTASHLVACLDHCSK